MRMDILLDGTAVVKADIDVSKVGAILAAALRAIGGVAKSTPMTPEQASELITRINSDSVTFLREIAQNNGSIKWGRMVKLFGYGHEHWAGFTGSHNRGINASMGAVIGQSGCKLTYTIEEEPEWTVPGWPNGRVYVDGEALHSLRVAFGYEPA